jgi:KDO2-lipid IV(A) lauroyltransferase
MAQQRARAVDFAVYLAVRVVVCIVQMLTPAAALWLADALAWLMYKVDRRHRLVADENLRFALPHIEDDRERDRLVRACYRHFCGLLVTIIHLPRKFHVHQWKDYLGLVGGKQLVAALLSGRPVLLVTGHFGNWEMGGFALGLFGFQTFAIARRLDNPYLERFLHDFRRHTGQTILDKNEDYDRMMQVLRTGGALATLGDQDAGQRGLFVEFFNRPASTHKAVALMALEHNAAMVVLGVPRIAWPMRHAIVIEDVILPEEYADAPDAVRQMTQRFTRALEALARRHPEQYFWLHRRWKHQPKERVRKKAA